MGLWSRLFGVVESYDAAQRVLPEPYEPFMGTGGIPVMDPGTPLEMLLGERSQVEVFWRTQPNLRKVVDFIARNIASIPLRVYDRESDTDRKRITDHPLADTLRSPQPRSGAYRFWHAVISDGLLYDRWCALKVDRYDGGLDLIHVPSWRLRIDVDPLRRVTALRYWQGDRHGDHPDWVDIDLDEAIFDFGYAPRTAGLTPVHTLRDILDESTEAVSFRRAVWENGPRVPGYVYRPEGAKWTEEQRNRFVESMRSVYGRDGSAAGGMPVFEDGMEIKSTDVYTPQDANDLEGRQLSAIEVSAAFHIAPELVGARPGNYSNVREFRQMLYRDSLGPHIKALEDVLNSQLVPHFGDGADLYVEANVESKLRGSFEEQSQVMQSATGAPWMTRNEARAMQNRPPVEGGDELVVPLNVLTGGQASPRDSGEQNRASPAGSRVKARQGQTLDPHTERVLADFFERQGRSVASRVGAGESSWWDADRWDGELSATLAGLYLLTATESGRSTLESLGVSPDEYDEPRTQAFLVEAARLSSESINETTRDEVQAAIDDPDAEVTEVFDRATTQRAAAAAATVVTFATGFGAVEAAKQSSGGRATKTWVTTSSNPRATHAAMNGETVGIDETFSNGLDWPGAFGPADEVAGCQCDVLVDFPNA